MNQSGKRGKGRGGSNRGRRTTGSWNHSNFTQSPGDEHESSAFENVSFVHAVTSLLGYRIQLTTPSGAVYDGILRAISPKFEVALDIAHKLMKKTQYGKSDEFIQVPSRNDTIETLVFAARNVVSIYALNVDRDQVLKKDTFTDLAISNKLNGQVAPERELKKWEDPGGGNEVSYMLEDNDIHNGLDADEMLAINEQKYGVKSSFDSEMLSYTTVLEKPPNKDFKERERKAEILAREIEQDGSYLMRSEIDSGKTEEELYSSVLRSGTPTSGPPLPPAHRNSHVAAAAHKDDRKPEQSTDKPTPCDQAVICQPIPQRLQQSRANIPSSDKAQKAATNNQEEEKAPPGFILKRDTTIDRKIPDKEIKGSNTSPVSVKKTVSPVSGKPVPQVAGTAAQAGYAIRVISSSSAPTGPNPSLQTSTKPTTELKQPEKKISQDKPDPNVIAELRNFNANFKLAEPTQSISRGVPEEKRKLESPSPDVAQKPEESRSTPSPQHPRQRESPKPAAEQKSGRSAQPSTTQDTTIIKKSSLNPNAKEFKMNPLAKEFRPSHSSMQRTPPLATTPQSYHQPVPGTLAAIPVPYSPTSGRPGGFGPIPQTQSQIYKAPRSPIHPQPMRYFTDPTHAPPTVISAAMATGKPIIAPSMPQQYISMGPHPQTMAFPPGMMQQMMSQSGGAIHNMYVVQAGSQPGQPRYVQPQSAGMTTASVAHSIPQGYQDGTMSAPIYVAATPPHQSPAQASPSHQGQFFQYQAVPQMIQQQPPGLPPQAQGHLGAPSPSQLGHHQQLLYLSQPQGTAQQSGGQVAAPSHQMGQFIAQGHPSQHPSMQSYLPGN